MDKPKVYGKIAGTIEGKEEKQTKNGDPFFAYKVAYGDKLNTVNAKVGDYKLGEQVDWRVEVSSYVVNGEERQSKWLVEEQQDTWPEKREPLAERLSVETDRQKLDRLISMVQEVLDRQDMLTDRKVADEIKEATDDIEIPF